MEIELDAKTGERTQQGRGFGSQPTGSGRQAGEYEGASSGGAAQKSIEGWVLIVTGIHEEAQEEDLHEAFADYGNVKSIQMNLDRRTGYVKGYALVEYADRAEAEAAIRDFDGKELLTRPVRVGWAFAPGPLKKKR